MKLANMQPYEVVLLMAGSLLFLVTLVLLVMSVMKGTPKAIMLIPFFIITVIMMGFPAIGSFSYADWKVDIKNKSDQLETNPADTVAQRALVASLRESNKGRIEKDPEGQLLLAKGYYALGNYDSASTLVAGVLNKQPNTSAAQVLHDKIENQVKLQRDFEVKARAIDLTIARIANKKTAATVAELDTVSALIAQVKVPVYAPVKSTVILSKALAITNQNDAAVKLLNQQAPNAVTRKVEDSITHDRFTPNKTYKAATKFRLK